MSLCLKLESGVDLVTAERLHYSLVCIMF